MRPLLRRSLILVSFAVAATACNKPAETAAAPAAAATERPVKAVKVSTGDIVDAVEVVGELQGIEEVKVFALVPERIRTLAVREGDKVKKGQLLATIEGDIQSEAVNQAQAALEAALANRDVLKDQLARTRHLAQAGSAPKSQLEQLENQFRAAEAQVRSASAAAAQALAQRGKTVITAPIAGTVAQLNLRQGDLASTAMPILTLVRDSRVKAVFRVPERDFLRVKEQMKVTVAPLATPEQKVEATVTLKGPVVDRMTRTGLVEVHLENTDGALVAGSAVRGVIELERRPGVVLVPAEAVLLAADTERTRKATAFVVEDKKAQRREVKLGVRQQDQLEVVEGLKAGESLIVQGVHLLRDDHPVKVLGAEQQENG